MKTSKIFSAFCTNKRKTCVNANILEKTGEVSKIPPLPLLYMTMIWLEQCLSKNNNKKKSLKIPKG